ncbi:hypothetical protein D3C83_327240 [compost metagenome]
MNLGAKLFPQVSLKEIAEADLHRIVAEFTLLVDEAGNLFRRQGGVTAQQREV